jgi:short-subunit dehydrogenase
MSNSANIHGALRGTVLITGASSGIGATYAERLARRGHDLVLVARDLQRLEVLAARLRDSGGVKVDVLQADLTKREDLARVDSRLRDDAQIGVLVNNAGVAVPGKLIETDIDKVEAMLQLNITAPTRLAHAAGRAFAARGQGAIINIASVTALIPEGFSGTYSGTKAYMLNLSQSMSAELSAGGVRVQAVLPGITRTEIWDRSGVGMSGLPQEMIMEVGELVDAALAGFALGETVTIPSLPDIADWNSFTALRAALQPNLSRAHAAARYEIAAVVG